MKKIYYLIAIAVLTIIAFQSQRVQAQSPEKMSYQAVVRDANNDLVSDQSVGMQISILQGSTSGTSVYSETQNQTTNANGLVSVEIGSGTTSDDFSTIDWANGPYFIKTETDPAGGTNYSITGMSQLMSVPYALHAKTADNILDSTAIANMGFVAGAHTVNTDTQTLTVSQTGDTLTINGGNSVLVPGISALNYPPAIGDFREGGIVFWIDGNGGGLVVDMTDLSAGAEWGCAGTIISGADGSAIGTGAQNTIDIEAGCTTTGTAADLCANATTGGYSDWFLPSTGELQEMYNNLSTINTAITANSGTAIPPTGIYWSSTENSNTDAWSYHFNSGQLGFTTKNVTYRVRAVRAF